MELIRVCVTLSCVLAFACGQGDSEEVFDEFVSRPNLQFCPENATCGDVFFQRRLLRDGSRRPENRHITNCICPGSGVCKFDNAHAIYQSTTHREYLCKPVSNYDQCRPGQEARRLRMNSENLQGQSYFEILCLCPRHLNPVGQGTAGKSTYETFPARFDSSDYANVRPYRCTGMRERQNRRRQRKGNNIGRRS